MADVATGGTLDQYRVEELLSRGGMASIFKATDTESGRAVVLKIPHIQYESDVVFFERFRREEEIGLRIDHPNVIRVLQPREKSRPYIVMEYFPGKPLIAALREKGRLAVEEALEIVGQVCEALVCLHEQGVVHRDIKPENILVDARGRVKIIDFGIALLKSARRLTWTGLSPASGTPDYAAPERIRGKRGDARTDVYAVGILLYELVTGNLPWDEPCTAALFHAKANQEPRPPCYHVPGFDHALENVILKAIEREPRDRQASAAELLADLRNPQAAVRRRYSSRESRIKISIVLAAIFSGLAALVWLSSPHG